MKPYHRRRRFVARTVIAVAFAYAVAAASPAPARAEWRPDGIRPAAVSLATVLAAHARASGSSGPASRRRRERWVYAAGGMRVDVGVAVRDDDYRTSGLLADRTYEAGRLDGVRWRADANGVAHDVIALEFGDALDRPPQSAFGLDAASCSLVGEVRDPRPAWIVRTVRHHEPPAFLYVDEATGSVVRETWREAPRIVTIALDDFRPEGAASRAHHWSVDDGVAADHIDATLAAVGTGDVAATDVRRPPRSTFATGTTPETVDVPATFDGGAVIVPVVAGDLRLRFVLDTTDPGLLVTPGLAKRLDGSAMQHATLPSFEAGPFSLARASATIATPLGPFDGLLGSSFFLGHVVEIDYPHERLRVLSPADAARAFADARVTTVAADVSTGLLLAPATLGTARGDAFVIDVTSPDIAVSRTFAMRHAATLARWTRTSPAKTVSFAAGSETYATYRIPTFSFAGASARDQRATVQLESDRRDDVDAPFDGTIGYAYLRNFDVLVDYDGGRIGLRP